MTSKSIRIVVVEDERAMREMLVLAFEQEGYLVKALASGGGLLDLVQSWKPDLLLLDIGLPGADGISLLPAIRARTEVPVFFLTARDETSEKVRALEAGADHYVTKPVELDELFARITAALRRPALVEENTLFTFETLELDRQARQVYQNGRFIDLTPREFALLEVFLRTPGKAFSKIEILEQVWGIDHDGDWAIVDRYISYVRLKLEAGGNPRVIQTVRGIGYALRAREAS